MIWTGIEWVTNIFECWMVIYFIKNILSFNKAFHIVVTTIAISAFVILCNSSEIFSNLTYIAVILICIILAFIYSKSKWYSKIFAVISFFLLLMLIDALVLVLFSKISAQPIHTFLELGMGRLVCTLISKMSLFVASTIIVKKFSLRSEKLEMTYYLPIIFIILSCIIVSAFVLENSIKNWTVIEYNNSMFIMLIGFISISFITIYIFDKAVRNSENKNKLNMLEQQLIFQEANVLETKENHLEIRKVWHDIYNHLNNIALLLKNDKINECVEFIEEYTNTVNDINLKINSGNVFIDALVSRKISECNHNEIAFEQDIILTDEIKIDNIDICIIIGNALDNAIEACRKLDVANRKIAMQMKMLKNYIIIDIKNAVSDNPFSKTGKLQTAKQDKSRHGLGLLNIKNIVNKYNGELNLKCENNVFISNTILKNIPIIRE